MIISVNWLKKFTTINSSIDELATIIGARLVEIESVENRMLLLSGDQIHTGTTSTDERRCLINFNFLRYIVFNNK
jgi:hypothetical protein